MKLVVITPREEATFEVTAKTRAKNIFYSVCTSLGIQETWYFGLMYYGPDNEEMWVDKSNKTVKKLQNNGASNFHFKVKHYPEDVVKELIETITIEYIYLQVTSSIAKDEIFCPADTCVLLASYALQAKYGDYNSYEHDENILANHKLLPERLTKQSSMSMSDWYSDIIKMWRKHSGLDREKAMLEYLKLAQKLDMYGVSYIPVMDKKKINFMFGITTNGINIYKDDNRLKPAITFLWSEIRNMCFADKKFIIKMNDKSAVDFVVFTRSLRMSKCILNLAMGCHSLYLIRKNPELPEIAKLRANARRNKNYGKY